MTPAFENIPVELRALPQWVCWRLEKRDGKDTKVPYHPRGSRADASEPTTWSNFAQVAAACANGNRFSGVGFVFAGDYTGVDLDHHRDPNTGELDEFARQSVAGLNSYTEISQSGTGVHVILRGQIPSATGRRDAKRGVEMYSAKRFFVMTGQHLEGTPLTIEASQPQVEAMFREIFPAKNQGPEKAAASKPPLSDAELIERASRATNGARFSALYRGDWNGAGYGSQSEADAALLSMLRFWTAGDKARSFQLFGQSGMKREKWERADYREATWAAIDHGEVYSAKRKAGSVASEYLGAETGAVAWTEPKPLPADLPAVPPFNFACLPATLRAWIGEALPLDWESVDFGEKVLHVQREKRGTTPWVPILPEMDALLRDMRKRAASHLLFPSPFDADKSRDGAAFNHRLTAACRALGLGHVTPHGLRSYFVTQARESGLSDAEIAMLIGDKTGPAIIAHTYGDVRPDHLLKQAQRIRLTVQACQSVETTASSPKSSPTSPDVSPSRTESPGGANIEKVPVLQGF